MGSADETGVLGYDCWKKDVVVVHGWTEAERPNYENGQLSSVMHVFSTMAVYDLVHPVWLYLRCCRK